MAPQARLREVLDELLGPLRWSAATHGADPAAWQPTVLGINKRDFLQQEVLTEIRRVRANAQLAADVEDSLREMASTATTEAADMQL